MIVKQIERSDRRVRFDVKDMNTAQANIIRQAALKGVPTMAIETVDIHVNTSALYSEVLAHRLGMIPLAFNPKDYKLPKDCDCEEGCEKCRVVLVLDKTGPCTVYAKDMKSTDKNVKPVDGDIIIAKLLKDQELKLEATAILGQGSDHSKWVPGLVGFQEYPKTVVDDKGNETAVSKAAIDKALSGKNAYNMDVAELAREASGKKAVNVKGDENHVIMSVESTSSKSPREIVEDACDIVMAALKDLEKKVKEAL